MFSMTSLTSSYFLSNHRRCLAPSERSSQEMTAGRRKLIYEDVLEVMQLSADGPVDAQMGRWVDGFDGFYGETAEALMRQEVDRLQ